MFSLQETIVYVGEDNEIFFYVIISRNRLYLVRGVDSLPKHLINKTKYVLEVLQ